MRKIRAHPAAVRRIDPGKPDPLELDDVVHLTGDQGFAEPFEAPLLPEKRAGKFRVRRQPLDDRRLLAPGVLE